LCPRSSAGEDRRSKCCRYSDRDGFAVFEPTTEVAFTRRFGPQELPVRAIQGIHVAVAVGVDERFDRCAVVRNVGEESVRSSNRSPTYVRRVLIVPLQFPGGRVECDDGIGVQVGAGAGQIGQHGPGLPTPQSASWFRDRNCRSATSSRRRFYTCRLSRCCRPLARRGNRVEFPELVAGGRIECNDEPAAPYSPRRCR